MLDRIAALFREPEPEIRRYPDHWLNAQQRPRLTERDYARPAVRDGEIDISSTGTRIRENGAWRPLRMGERV